MQRPGRVHDPSCLLQASPPPQPHTPPCLLREIWAEWAVPPPKQEETRPGPHFSSQSHGRREMETPKREWIKWAKTWRCQMAGTQAQPVWAPILPTNTSQLLPRTQTCALQGVLATHPHPTVLLQFQSLEWISPGSEMNTNVWLHITFKKGSRIITHT